MESRVEKTIERRKKGYNCSQAVVCTYCDLLGMDEKAAFRLSEGFGSGMGGMEGVCGALSGAVMLTGLKNSDGNLEEPKTKGQTCKLSKEMIERFKKECGSIICKELKGVDTGKPMCSCPDCIKGAAAIAESILFGEENE